MPQEVQLYQDFGCFHVPGESLQNITAEEMHRRLRGIQTSLGHPFLLCIALPSKDLQLHVLSRPFEVAHMLSSPF